MEMKKEIVLLEGPVPAENRPEKAEPLQKTMSREKLLAQIKEGRGK